MDSRSRRALEKGCENVNPSLNWELVSASVPLAAVPLWQGEERKAVISIPPNRGEKSNI